MSIKSFCKLDINGSKCSLAEKKKKEGRDQSKGLAVRWSWAIFEEDRVIMEDY
jgi:hypothetical protein